MTGNDLPDFTFDIGEYPAIEQEEVKKEEQKPVPAQVDTATPPPVVETPPPVVTGQPPVEPVVQNQPGEAVSEEEASYYKGLLGFWKDEGLVNYEGEFDGSKERFAEILRQQRLSEQEAIQAGIIDAIPEQAQALVEYILTEGEALSIEKLKGFLELESEVQSIPEITNDEAAKAYLLNKFAKIHNQSMAEKFVEALEDEDNLVFTAKAEIEKDKANVAGIEQQRIEQAKLERAQRQQEQEQFASSLNTELRSLGWKSDIQKAVYDDIFSGAVRDKTASLAKYPKALLKVTNYLRFLDPKTGDIDETAFAKAAFSDAAKELKSTIERNFSRSGVFGGGDVVERREDKNAQYEYAD